MNDRYGNRMNDQQKAAIGAAFGAGAVAQMREERQEAIAASSAGNGQYVAEVTARQAGVTAGAMEAAHMRGYEEGFKAAEAMARQRAIAAAEEKHDAAKYADNAKAEKHESECQAVTWASETPGACTCGRDQAIEAQLADEAEKHESDCRAISAAEEDRVSVSNIKAYTTRVTEAGGKLVCACGRDYLKLAESKQPIFLDMAGNCYCKRCRLIFAFVGGLTELKGINGECHGVALQLMHAESDELQEDMQYKAFYGAFDQFKALERAAEAASARAWQAETALRAIRSAAKIGAEAETIAMLVRLGLHDRDASLDGTRRTAVLVALALASSEVGRVTPGGDVNYSDTYLNGFNSAVEKARAAVRGVIDKL